ncbi:MAG: glycosyltransferase family 2 protein [Candidatus Moranbacteria bacterium]|nr:glycosyltransferase family 2 protein [Candidatus Moranbacteria bacterium]
MDRKRSKLKIVAVIPVYGRLPLLRHTITRLYEKNGVNHVICVGGKEEKAVCKKHGAQYIEDHKNILGAKWNKGFKMARAHTPTHILFVGSSDFICDDFLNVVIPHCPEYGMVGTKGFYMAHVEKAGSVKAGRWHGYKNREDSIGIGRIISSKILDKIGWKPFDDRKTNGMDWMMHKKVLSRKGLAVVIDDPKAMSLSISTDQWGNKHSYGDSTGTFTEIDNPKEFLSSHFPETLKIF